MRIHNAQINTNTYKLMTKEFRRSELMCLDTIEQAWDGDELKIDEGDFRVWLVARENRAYNGDYVVETLNNGKWEQESFHF